MSEAFITNALKQITDVVDAAATPNHTHVEYDNLGRRELINNPDTGLTRYKYDLASNPKRGRRE